MQGRTVKQEFLNFDRGRKLRALERAALPKVVRLPGGKGVSAKAMSSVLKAIDSCARDNATCRVTLSQLAGRVHMSQDHCGRTIQALELIFLLAVTDRFAQRRREPSEYRIIWGNLESLVQADPGLSQDDLGLSQDDPGSERYSKDLSSSKISKNTTTKTTARGGGGGDFWNSWKLGWLQQEQFGSQEAADRLFERMVDVGQGGLTADDRETFYAVILCLKREKRAGKITNGLGAFRSLFSGDRGRWINRAEKRDLERARGLMEARR